MIVKRNEGLKARTTFHIGGIAKYFYIPENANELVDLVCSLRKNGASFKILSGGSNLLINDLKEFDNVIYMAKVAEETIDKGNGRFYIGASNRIQKVISFVNDAGYGGFEELIGLPALFGGIIYMNAGVGGKHNVRFNIADFIECVKVLKVDTGEIIWLGKFDCAFGYRTSLFQNDQYIILGAELILEKQLKENSSARIKMRQEYIKNNQEWGKGCFGTCFSQCNKRILKIVRMMKLGGGVYQSSKNPNWFVNDGTGTYVSAMRLINVCRALHMIAFQKIECEVRIWE